MEKPFLSAQSRSYDGQINGRTQIDRTSNAPALGASAESQVTLSKCIALIRTIWLPRVKRERNLLVLELKVYVFPRSITW